MMKEAKITKKSEPVKVAAPKEMEPSIGHIVHMHTVGDHPPSPVAAIVTAVHEGGIVDLTVFAPGAASTPKMGVSHVVDVEHPYWIWPK